MEPYKQSNLGNKRTYRVAHISHCATAQPYTVSYKTNKTNTTTSNNAPDFGSNSRSYGRFIHVEPYRQPNKCDRLSYNSFSNKIPYKLLSDHEPYVSSSDPVSYHQTLVCS